jgi:hypothetical protein
MFNIDDYNDQESLAAEVAKRQRQAQRLKDNATAAKQDYDEAQMTGSLRGKKLTPAQIQGLRDDYNSAAQTADDNDIFLTEAQKPNQLKPRADVKKDAEAKAAKEKAEKDMKSTKSQTEERITGQTPRVKVTPESQIVQGARGMAKAPDSDFTLWKVLSGQAPMGPLAQKLNYVNPLALLTGPARLAQAMMAGRMKANASYDPMNLFSPKLNMSPQAAIDDPESAAEFAVGKGAGGTGDPEDVARRAAAVTNDEIARLSDTANRTLNRTASDDYATGVKQKVGQLATTGGILYGAKKAFGIGEGPKTLGRAIGDSEQLSGPTFRALMAEVEPFRVEEIGGQVKALSEKREALLKDIRQSLSNKFGADVESAKGDDLWAVMGQLGMNSDAAKDFVTKNRESIGKWSTKRDFGSVSEMNRALNSVSPDMAPVYLGEDGSGNMRFAVNSKKAGSQPSWVIATLPARGGRLSVVQEESDLDKTPFESSPDKPFTKKDYSLLPGAPRALERYREKKKGTPEATPEF